MTYESFEDLPVWRDAIDLATRIFELTEDRAFYRQGDIANQLQRAGLSVSNNIAEGFERGTTGELITFLYYAKGSAGEVRSVCHVITRLKRFEHLREAVADLLSAARAISRQLAAWALSLQESDIPGARHRTSASKDEYERRHRAETLMAQLRQEHAERVERLVAERKSRAKAAGETPPGD